MYTLPEGETKKIDRYTITTLKANHSTCTEALHFIISDGAKRLFYGLDGAWLLYDEVTAIKSSKIDYACLIQLLEIFQVITVFLNTTVLIWFWK